MVTLPSLPSRLLHVFNSQIASVVNICLKFTFFANTAFLHFRVSIGPNLPRSDARTGSGNFNCTGCLLNSIRKLEFGTGLLSSIAPRRAWCSAFPPRKRTRRSCLMASLKTLCLTRTTLAAYPHPSKMTRQAAQPPRKSILPSSNVIHLDGRSFLPSNEMMGMPQSKRMRNGLG